MIWLLLVTINYVASLDPGVMRSLPVFRSGLRGVSAVGVFPRNSLVESFVRIREIPSRFSERLRLSARASWIPSQAACIGYRV